MTLFTGRVVRPPRERQITASLTVLTVGTGFGFALAEWVQMLAGNRDFPICSTSLGQSCYRGHYAEPMLIVTIVAVSVVVIGIAAAIEQLRGRVRTA